ncbi:MAG: molybdate ABC transporter substrate-binding protein [Gammaproteobacteria bacterium]|nr:molybdate ABC transporter substrate-binding protein [Gammaproteobacteria bacterium]
MSIFKKCFWFVTLTFLITDVRSALGAEVHIGVASNFSHTAKLLSDAYAEIGNKKPKLLFGSTGKHAAQIQRGLPIDLLLAADKERPGALLERGFGLAESKKTYAVGSLVFWTKRPLFEVSDVLRMIATICELDFKIAIANPRLAPYGVAAREILNLLYKENECSPRLIMGENVSQTVHFVKSGAVEAAFVPLSMSKHLPDGTTVRIPTQLHTPIEQQMLLLSSSSEAKRFYNFILSDEGRSIIRSNGYDLKHD